MNSVLIVLPILGLLMYDLGLSLRLSDFAMIFRRPKALLCGFLGQLVMLPGIAFVLSTFFGLESFFFTGFMLIACCPGGASSNILTGIAKGDVALSVSLTAFTTLITMVTMPLLLGFSGDASMWGMLIQNAVTMLLPIALGMYTLKVAPQKAMRIHAILGKVAFPALMLLATIFFVVNREVIVSNFSALGLVTTLLIAGGMISGYAIGVVGKLHERERRTLVIEVGVQNAAQAMALAASPIVFGNVLYAVPATIYSLMMNVLLLMYVGVVARFDPDRM